MTSVRSWKEGKELALVEFWSKRSKIQKKKDEKDEKYQ